MKKVISTVLALFMVLTFITAVIAEEGKKASKNVKAKGTIVSVEEKDGVTHLTFQPKRGEAMTFSLSEGCEIMMGRKKIATNDIKPQMKAKVFYLDGDTKIATKVILSKPRIAKKTKAETQ